jgi:8-oxo-dGTP diphosphatase
MGRTYPESPIPAVSGVILNENRKVLLVRRANPPALGEWSFPGGMVHLGEDLDEALVREIKEETGLVVRPGVLLSATSRIVHDDSKRILYHYVLLDYLCRVVSGKCAAGSDAGDVQWVRISEVPSLRVTDGLIRIIEKGIGV